MDMLPIVADVFNNVSRQIDTTAAWNEVPAWLLKKEVNPKSCGDFRLIGLSATLQQWYIHGLLLVLTPHYNLLDCIFGVRKGRQAADMAAYLSVLWGKCEACQIPLVMVKVDVSKAFASCLWSSIWQVL